jgi:hypothetical protein
MASSLNSLCSSVDWCKLCMHLRSLNILHFWMLEAYRIKESRSRSSSMACHPCWISWKSHSCFKNCWGHIDGQIAWNFTSLTVLTEWRLKNEISLIYGLHSLLKEITVNKKLLSNLNNFNFSELMCLSQLFWTLCFWRQMGFGIFLLCSVEDFCVWYAIKLSSAPFDYEIWEHALLLSEDDQRAEVQEPTD